MTGVGNFQQGVAGGSELYDRLHPRRNGADTDTDSQSGGRRSTTPASPTSTSTDATARGTGHTAPGSVSRGAAAYRDPAARRALASAAGPATDQTSIDQLRRQGLAAIVELANFEADQALKRGLKALDDLERLRNGTQL